MEVDVLGKKCGLCGNELSAFGSKQLADGIICRDCAAKLSEWLTDEVLAETKLSKIKKHLKYREENAMDIQAFAPNIVSEGKYKLYIDEQTKKFAISKKKDLVKDNADIVKLSSVKSITVSKADCPDSEGVDIMMELAVRSRQFKTIKFRVNEFPGIEEESEAYTQTKEIAEKYIELFAGAGISERKVVRDYGE